MFLGFPLEWRTRYPEPLDCWTTVIAPGKKKLLPFPANVTKPGHSLTKFDKNSVGNFGSNLIMLQVRIYFIMKIWVKRGEAKF